MHLPQTLTEEGQRLDTASRKELDIGRRVAAERAVVERQLQQSRLTAERLRQQAANYRVPPTMDYVHCNDRVYKLKRKNVIWKRKLDISKMTLMNLRAVTGIKVSASGPLASLRGGWRASEEDESTLEDWGECDGATERPGVSPAGARQAGEVGSALSVVSSKLPVTSKTSLHN